MIGNAAILGLNYVALYPSDVFSVGYGGVTVGSEDSNMPGTNLAIEEPSDRWRTATRPFPFDCWCSWGQSSAGQVNPPINAIGLVNHNLTRSALVRVGRGLFSTPEILVPASIAASTNLTGAVTDIDEGDTPGGDLVQSTVDTLPFDLRLTFPTPSGAPLAGSKQFFLVYAKRQATSPDNNTQPTLTAYLYENGVQVAELATKNVKSTVGQWLIFPWDADDLGTPDGSQVELSLEGTEDHGGARIDSVVWVCEQSGDFDLSIDSGWYSPVVDVGRNFFGIPSSESPAQQSFLYVHPTTSTTAGRAFVLILDDGSPADADPARELILAPPVYVEAGVFCVGLAQQPDVNFDWGPLLGARDFSSKKFTQGAQTYGSRNPILRTLRLTFSGLKENEAFAMFDRIGLRRGVLGPILVAPFPDDEVPRQVTTIYCTPAGEPELSTEEAWIDGEPSRPVMLDLIEKR